MCHFAGPLSAGIPRTADGCFHVLTRSVAVRREVWPAAGARLIDLKDWAGRVCEWRIDQVTRMAPMEPNRLPTYDQSHNETGCCPRFDPAPWEGQELHLRDKAFVRAKTISLFHIPLNMGSVFEATSKAIKDAGAEEAAFAVLSRDLSPWSAEHLFAVSKPVPGVENVTLSGDFVTHVFEGPYSEAAKWCKDMERYAEAKGRHVDKLYFFYTTCPKCAKHYGKNYVVGIAQVESGEQRAAA
jgi:hypothetical protein